MKTVTFTKIFNRRYHQLGKDDLAAISIRITINRKSCFIDTGFKIIAAHWNKRTNEINHRHPNFVSWNSAINAMIEKCRELHGAYLKRNEMPSFTDFKKLLEPEQVRAEAIQGKDFLKFYEKCIDENPNAEQQSKENYRKCIPHLKMVNPFPLFGDINKSYILAFENAMKEEGLKPGTRYRRHKYIKPVLQECLEQGFILTNPYEDKQVKALLKRLGQESKSPKEVLTEAEITKLENLVFPPDLRHLEVVRDMFLFACFTGMRLYDFTHFQKKWLRIEDETMFLTFKPQKKGSRQVNSVPLHEIFDGKPRELVLKYIENKTEFVFPVRSEKDINVPLKEIAKMAEIDKVLSSHVGRYTFCTTMAKIVTPEILKLYTGHANSATLSDYYIHINTKMRDEAYAEALINKF